MNPREVPAAQAIVRRLCALQAHVCTEVLGHDDPNDCFCGDEGFWPLEDPADFRNVGTAVDFIEEATLAEIARRKAAAVNQRSRSETPGPGVKCPKCGDGAERCMYCSDLAAPDWEAICDCGLYSHGFHLISCDISKAPVDQRSRREA